MKLNEVNVTKKWSSIIVWSNTFKFHDPKPCGFYLFWSYSVLFNYCSVVEAGTNITKKALKVDGMLTLQKQEHDFEISSLQWEKSTNHHCKHPESKFHPQHTEKNLRCCCTQGVILWKKHVCRKIRIFQKH